MTQDKTFPIRQDDEIKTVPWAMLEEHRAQARANHGGRELEDIAIYKGGLTPCEAVAILEDREWERMPFTGATLRLRELVDEWHGVVRGVDMIVNFSINGETVSTRLPVEPDTFGNLAKAAALAKSMQRHVNGGSQLFNQYQTLINLIEQSQLEVTAMRSRLRKS